MNKAQKEQNIATNIWRLQEKKRKIEKQIEKYYDDLRKLNQPKSEKILEEPSSEELQNILEKSSDSSFNPLKF